MSLLSADATSVVGERSDRASATSLDLFVEGLHFDDGFALIESNTHDVSLHLILVVEGMVTLVAYRTEVGATSFLEECKHFLRQSIATDSILPECQLNVRVDSLCTVHIVDVGVIFFDLIFLRRTDVEVTAIDFFFEGRSTRDEAVVVVLRDRFIALRTPSFFLLTDVAFFLSLMILSSGLLIISV